MSSFTTATREWLNVKKGYPNGSTFTRWERLAFFVGSIFVLVLLVMVWLWALHGLAHTIQNM